MKTPKRKLLSISAAARKQGCQRDTIYNWIDGGLKTHGGKIDPAELSAFAVTRSRKAPVIGHLAKAARAAEAAGGADAERITTELAAITGALDSGEGLDGALSRLKMMERFTFKRWSEAATPEGQTCFCRLHSDCATNLARVGSLIDGRKELTEKIYAEFESAFRDWSAPIKSHLQIMPRTLAPGCNPVDPPTAEVYLRDWLDKTFYPLLNAKPRTPDSKEGSHDETKAIARPS